MIEWWIRRVSWVVLAGRLTTCENLQNNQRKGELRESSPDVCALEGPTLLLIRVSLSFA